MNEVCNSVISFVYHNYIKATAKVISFTGAIIALIGLTLYVWGQGIGDIKDDWRIKEKEDCICKYHKWKWDLNCPIHGG